MKRLIVIAALSLVLAFGLSLSNASAGGFDIPNTEELLAEAEATLVNVEENKAENQYRALEPVEEEINFEKAAEEAGAGL